MTASECFWEAYRAATFAVFLRAHFPLIDATPVADLARELWRQALAEQARAART
jgi:hypothetical protein